MDNQQNQPPFQPQNPFQSGTGPQPQPAPQPAYQPQPQVTPQPQPTYQPQPVAQPQPQFVQPEPTSTPAPRVEQPNPMTSMPMQPIQNPVANKDTQKPGKAASIIGLIMAFLGLSLPGLIFCAIGKSKSKKAGQKNGIATAGIILNLISLIATLAIGYLFFTGFALLSGDQNKVKYNAAVVKSYAEKYFESREAFPDEYSDFEEGTIDGKSLSEYVTVTNTVTESNAKTSIVYQYTGEFGDATGGRILFYDFVTNNASDEVIYLGDADENSTFIDIL